MTVLFGVGVSLALALTLASNLPGQAQRSSDSDYAGRPDLTQSKADRGNAPLDGRRPRPGEDDREDKEDEADRLERDWTDYLKLNDDRRRDLKKTVSPSPFSEEQGLLKMDVGSQFNEHSFQDDDYGKHDFIDFLIDTADRKPMDLYSDDYDSGARDSDTDANSHAHKLYTERDEEERDRDREKVERRRELARRYEDRLVEAPPPEVGPNNWVPDKLDPLNMGGFTTSPDNGSPVPYRLNGHVDLERELPWLKDDLEVPSKGR